MAILSKLHKTPQNLSRNETIWKCSPLSCIHNTTRKTRGILPLPLWKHNLIMFRGLKIHWQYPLNLFLPLLDEALLLLFLTRAEASQQVYVHSSLKFIVQEPSMAKNSSSSRAPKTGGKSRRLARNKASIPPKTPSHAHLNIAAITAIRKSVAQLECPRSLAMN